MESKVLDPLDGVWLRTALGYLLAVVPRDGDHAKVVFTQTDEGQPLLVAHAWIAEPRDTLYPREGETSNPFPPVRLAPPANPEN